MGWLFGSDNEDKKERSHWDNCLYSEIDSEKWDNGEYQECPFCGKKLNYKWDRCDSCHNN